MDNLFEKFTLYDLVGYTIPGTILLCTTLHNVFMIAYNTKVLKEYNIYICIVTLVLGYCVGVAVCGGVKIIRELCVKIIRKVCNIGFAKIGYGAIAKALCNSGIITQEVNIKKEEEVLDYLGYIFSEIQVSSDYKRLHNYASMQLFCENMALSGLVSMIIITAKYYNVIAKGYIVAGFFLVILFLVQAIMFYKRTNFYAVAWFVKSHIANVNHSE